MSSFLAIPMLLALWGPGGWSLSQPEVASEQEAPVGHARTPCQPKTDAEHLADSMITLLTSEEVQSVQFAVDSLVLLREEITPFLVCHLEEPARLRTRELIMFLNRNPQRFEAIAHYSPLSVGHALALVLGSPPGTSAPCGSEGNNALGECARAWEAALSEAGK